MVSLDETLEHWKESRSALANELIVQILTGHTRQKHHDDNSEFGFVDLLLLYPGLNPRVIRGLFVLFGRSSIGSGRLFASFEIEEACHYY